MAVCVQPVYYKKEFCGAMVVAWNCTGPWGLGSGSCSCNVCVGGREAEAREDEG